MILLICYEKTSDFDLDQAIEIVAMAIFAIAPRPQCHQPARDHAVRARLQLARKSSLPGTAAILIGPGAAIWAVRPRAIPVFDADHACWSWSK